MKTVNWVVAAAVAASLAGCGGAEEIASPGSGGNITINTGTSSSASSSSSTNANLATPAAGCPTIANPTALRDDGTITGPTGTYRVCALPGTITANTTLERLSGVLYALDGRVNVGADLGAAVAGTGVTLTIQPGVIIYAKTGVSWLAVNRGNRISAIGTAARPIVFTSRDNVLGLANDASQGQWGGVVLLGRAPITDCIAGGATPGTEACERDTEGVATTEPARYGGATPADNSGTLRYVQIRYSGYVLSGNSELQSLTNEGVGSGTSISYIQSHNSSDDAFENFGGNVSMKYLVLTGADDDNIDVDTGWRGTLQYVIAVQKTTGTPDSIIELDSANSLEENTPRTYLKLANFTFVHRNPASGNNAAMLFRGGADASLVNGVVTTQMACLRLHNNGADTGAGDNIVNILSTDASIQKVGAPVFRSVVMQCSATPFLGTGGTGGAGAPTIQQVTDTFGSGSNNNNSAFTATLTSTFVNGANETAVTATDPKTIDSLFDTTNYVGAVRNASDTWYAGWTCNSSTANFGSTSSDCTSLPSLN